MRESYEPSPKGEGGRGSDRGRMRGGAPGTTRSQVAAIAGKPSSEVTMIHARGTCQTYILGQRDGKAETYFVALDDTGHVINSGYQTCAEYDTDPQAPKAQ